MHKPLLKIRRRVRPALLALLAPVVLTASCGGPPLERAVFLLMGTEVKVTAIAASRARARAAIDGCVARMSHLEGLLSRRLASSDIARCNSSAGREAVPVAPATFAVLAESRRFSELTGGAFDITVMPFIRVWMAAARTKTLPAEALLAATAARVGSAHLKLDAGARTVRFTGEGVAIDLGAIAKGYIVDQGLDVLRRSGVSAGLIEAGGDIAAFGRKPDGGAWHIGVQDPTQPQSRAALVEVIEVGDAAVATSGNYRRFFEINGKRYSHILDPRTGRPADAVPSVTIIARDATTADALATAVSVLGVEEGMKLIESLPGVEALLITIGEDGPAFHESSGFCRYRAPGSPARPRVRGPDGRDLAGTAP